MYAFALILSLFLSEVSRYIWNSFAYLRKDPSAEDNELEKDIGKSGAVVTKLMQDLYLL